MLEGPRRAGQRAYLYQGGLAQVIPGEPTIRVIRWDYVTEITLAFTEGDVSVLTVRDGQGTEITPAGDPAQLGEIAAEAERALAPRFVPPLLWAYDSGSPAWSGIPWNGACAIDQQGISVRPGQRPASFLKQYAPEPASFTPWSAITSIRMTRWKTRRGDGPVSQIVARRSSGPSLHLSFNGIPNGIFMAHVLQHAAGRQGIPVRVSRWYTGSGDDPLGNFGPSGFD
jgi:hypothetical protein